MRKERGGRQKGTKKMRRNKKAGDKKASFENKEGGTARRNYLECCLNHLLIWEEKNIKIRRGKAKKEKIKSDRDIKHKHRRSRTVEKRTRQYLCFPQVAANYK